MKLSVSIANFRSIASTTLHLSPGVNILIGPNGAGKTCLLSALKFLRDVLVNGAGLAMAKGGGYRRQYHRDAEFMRFRVVGRYGNQTHRRQVRTFRYEWSLEIKQSPLDQTTTITGEHISIFEPGQVPVVQLSVERKFDDDGTLLPSEVNFRIDPQVGFDFFSGYPERNAKAEKFLQIATDIGKRARQIAGDQDQSVLAVLPRLDHSFNLLFRYLLTLNEYNIVPDIARQSSDQLPFAAMEANGRNVSEVIWALERSQFNKVTTAAALRIERPSWSLGQSGGMFYGGSYMPQVPGRARLSEALPSINQELGSAVSSISRVTVDTDPTNGRRYLVFVADDGARFYPDQVSDGTLKWVCLLTGIYVPFSNIFLLEEPENFLHPWMQQKLLQIMRSQKDTVYLLTSHSATLLNAATPEEITVVTAGKGGTVATQIAEQKELADLLSLSNFGVGDLWVNGQLGGVPAGDSE